MDTRNLFETNESAVSDETLLKGVRLGNKEDTDELIRRYTRLVRRIARPYYLVGAEVEDLMQEGMMGLLKALREYEPSLAVPFSAFSERCIRSNIFTAIRNSRRKKHSPLNNYISFETPLFDGVVETGNYSSVVPNPEALILTKEAESEFYQALEGLLSTFEARILRLYLNGYTYGEIADMLEKPYKSVDNAITRIRRKLSAYHTSLGDSR